MVPLPYAAHRPPNDARTMTNRLAILLGLALLVAFAVDITLYGDAHMIFLGKKLAELIEWMAFWR